MTTLRYRSFDALKGLMILIVVLHHSLFVKGMHHGYLAVDMFFWIAGVFLMRDFLKKEQTTVQYTYRRLRKAFPPYLLSFGLAAVLDYKHLASFTDFDSLVEGEYGILTPDLEKGEVIPPEELDLIIVPGIAFDTRGERLGKGGGFYDAYLARATKAKRIALAFSCQLVAKIPMEDHDVRVHKIITEQGIYNCLL